MSIVSEEVFLYFFLTWGSSELLQLCKLGCHPDNFMAVSLSWYICNCMQRPILFMNKMSYRGTATENVRVGE